MNKNIRNSILVEGGHFTIRPSRRRTQNIDWPGIHYVETNSAVPAHPCEVHRTPSEGTRDRQYVVYETREGDIIRFSEEFNPSDIVTLLPPRQSEVTSWIKATEMAKEIFEKGSNVAIGLLVGDLKLPKELRRPIQWAIPQEYRRILNSHTHDLMLELFNESSCQNTGVSRVIKRAKSILVSNNKFNEAFDRLGLAVFKETSDAPNTNDSETIYMSSEWLMKNHSSSGSIIALTKFQNKPSCATTLAGKLAQIHKKGYSTIFSWYDASIDPLIRNKNIQGAIITAYFMQNLDLDINLYTLEPGFPIREDHFNLADYRVKGTMQTSCELMAAVSKEVKLLGLEGIDLNFPGECCVY